MGGKQVKYWLLIILLSYVPVIAIELLEKLLWYYTTLQPKYIITVDGIFSAGLFPIYLARINYTLAKKYDKDTFSFIINCFIILSGVIIGCSMCQTSYANSRGVVDDPEDFAFFWNGIEGMAALIVSILTSIATLGVFVTHSKEVHSPQDLSSSDDKEEKLTGKGTNKTEIKYWFLIIVLSYGVVYLSHLLVGPIWLHGKNNSGLAPVVEGLLGILILPTYLVRMNYTFAKKHKKSKRSFFINAAIIISCAFLSGYMNLEHCIKIMQPGDYNVTMDILAVETGLAIIISLVGIKGLSNKLSGKIKSE